MFVSITNRKKNYEKKHFSNYMSFYSRYIRLSDSTPMEKVKTLLLDYWNIFKPNHPHLALSLVGGAKNFRLEGRKKETFKVYFNN